MFVWKKVKAPLATSLCVFEKRRVFCFWPTTRRMSASSCFLYRCLTLWTFTFGLCSAVLLSRQDDGSLLAANREAQESLRLTKTWTEVVGFFFQTGNTTSDVSSRIKRMIHVFGDSGKLNWVPPVAGTWAVQECVCLGVVMCVCVLAVWWWSGVCGCGRSCWLLIAQMARSQ